ncbi:hypothetical protein BAL199_14772 [alpha proteobacterium BAL199]|nr:hypothetical protein BAL199_14772 [alpha proteobacterium BAL199]
MTLKSFNQKFVRFETSLLRWALMELVLTLVRPLTRIMERQRNVAILKILATMMSSSSLISLMVRLMPFRICGAMCHLIIIPRDFARLKLTDISRHIRSI